MRQDVTFGMYLLGRSWACETEAASAGATLSGSGLLVRAAAFC
jgi:hypothetical protein